MVILELRRTLQHGKCRHDESVHLTEDVIEIRVVLKELTQFLVQLLQQTRRQQFSGKWAIFGGKQNNEPEEFVDKKATQDGGRVRVPIAFLPLSDGC